jgi:hypothetical protein
MTDSRPPTPPPNAHDDRDINVRAITIFAGAMLVSALVIHIGLWVMNDRLLDAERAAHGPVMPMAAERAKGPPAPRLQANPVADLRAYRAAENERLRSYGWVDQARGVVHIPIERAIDLVAERGLPSRPPVAPAPGLAQPTESSLGVLPRREP